MKPEIIRDKSTIVAIIIRHQYRSDGISFFTPEDFSQQLAYMRRPSGHQIKAHVHNEVKRDVSLTQEVLFIRKGKIQVDLYSVSKRFLKSIVLTNGDVIMLASGGHGLTMIEESEIIEVKQGPYLQDADKQHFEPENDSD